MPLGPANSALVALLVNTSWAPATQPPPLTTAVELAPPAVPASTLLPSALDRRAVKTLSAQPAPHAQVDNILPLLALGHLALRTLSALHASRTAPPALAPVSLSALHAPLDTTLIRPPTLAQRARLVVPASMPHRLAV
jgi:hypothetical protein